MTTSSTLTGTARTVEEEFLDLVCADDEFVRAEFDALVAEVWSSRPPPADPSPAARGAGPEQQGGPAPSPTRLLGPRPRRPGAGGWRRQRSPPRA
ncbi:hypothetical protein [Pedococcus dokdonensis]|uniref:hypothetical protein n=1 Tax=Pedococcus dokdonensis TaxID=443156 RepID=UPI0012FD73ED|nr:hypothetical protein [Pedococcus dokdonensis]